MNCIVDLLDEYKDELFVFDMLNMGKVYDMV